jgi:type II secretory pathway pseudopilin PulG
MRKGFTLVELLTVVAIMMVLGLIGVLSLTSKKNSTDLSTTVSEAAALLREAESRSTTEAQGVVWGVHFANVTNTAPFYALFSSAYAPTATISYYRLPSDIAYATATLPVGSTTNIIFNQVSGLPVAAVQIGFVSLSQKSLPSSTISVTTSGAVTY